MTDIPPRVTPKEAERPLFAGLDVGGTNIKFGLVDDRGRTVIQDRIGTESDRGPEDAVQRMAQQITHMTSTSGIAASDIGAVGLATPGPLDISRGMILTPANLPAWRHFAIRDALQTACGKPVTFANDAGAAGFGEYWVGGGREYPSMVLLTLGTGIGAGIIIGDLSIDGDHSHGAECGHNIIDHNEDARLCTCGQRGHIEAYCSATAIVKRAEELLQSPRPTTIRQRLQQGDTLTTLLLAEEAESGDELSREIIQEAATFLGIGIVSIAHTIDPSIIVLGGAMDFGGADSELGQWFLGHVRDEFRRRAMKVLARETRIDFARLGGDAGYIGAAGLARAAYRRAHANP
jgi:glucokinase